MNLVSMGSRDRRRFKAKVDIDRERDVYLNGSVRAIRIFVYLKVTGNNKTTSVEELSEDLNMMPEDTFETLQQLRMYGLVETEMVRAEAD